MKKNRHIRPLWLALAATGICSFSGAGLAADGITAPTTSSSLGGHTRGLTNQIVNVGKVSAAAAVETASAASSHNFDNHVLSKTQIFHSSQSVTAVTKKQINLFNPSAGGIQALTNTPGVAVTGYNAGSVSGRSTVSLRGVQVGWNSVPGNLETNGITALFDGIPLNSVIQGTSWHSNEIPVGNLLSGINVIYGPGNPSSRWYDSIGGTINFIPVQPTRKSQAKVSVSYGSNQAETASAVANTGEKDGWSAVVATAIAHGDTFRTGAYNWPSQSNQIFAKVRKLFTAGRISFGAYWVKNNEMRPNDIPVSPIPGVTLGGLNQNAPLYSQTTSGFYSSLPNTLWFKNITNENYLFYNRLHLNIASDLKLANLLWYRHDTLHHVRFNLGFPPNNPVGEEDYFPDSSTYGDKLTFDASLPFNLVSFGGYYISADTVNRGLPSNPSIGTSNPTAINMNTYYNTFSAAFLEDHITPGYGLTLVPGIQMVNYKTQFINNNPQYALIYPNARESNTHPDLSDDIVRFQPSLGVTFQPVKGFTTYANYAITYQNPTGGNFSNTQTDLPALKPVKSTDYEVGFRVIKHQLAGIKKLYLNVNYYSDYLSNETIPIALASNPLVTTFGYGTATLNGVNATLSADLNRSWSSYLNLGLFHGYYNSYYSTSDNQSYNGNPVSGSPSMTMAFGVTYKKYYAGTLFSSTLWDQYYGHSYLFNNNTGAPSHQTNPGYNLLNVTLTARSTLLNKMLPGVKLTTIGLYFTNILNKQYNSTEYVTSGGYFGTGAGSILANPGAPRSVFGTISIQF
ncbi:MAG: TonB-dependent receptor [Acidithiobacillus sp.]